MVLNENTGYVEIKPDDLYNNKEIVFYAIGPDLPKHIEEASPDIEALSSKYRDRLNPSFKNE